MMQSFFHQGDILIVDDSPENLKTLQMILNQEGYQIRPAINGELALHSVKKQIPDLVILDIRMPGMDGYEVCRHFKADKRLADIPVIFISGLTNTEDKVKAFQAGGVDYIAKPFQAEEVLLRVKTHLTIRHTQSSLETANNQLMAVQKDLKHLNADLENRVSRRTAELEKTNMALQKSEARLKEQQTHLEEIVKERTAELERKAAELEIAKNQAESADRLKSVFLASISHELRTPLNSIIGFTGIILNELVGPLNFEQKKELRMAKASAHHLLDLINDVLDISKIETGELELSWEPFNMGKILEQTMEEMKPMATQKSLVLSKEIASDVEKITSDERRVRQVLINLIGNAIKFTDQGEVKISCQISKHITIVYLIYFINKSYIYQFLSKYFIINYFHLLTIYSFTKHHKHLDELTLISLRSAHYIHINHITS